MKELFLGMAAILLTVSYAAPQSSKPSVIEVVWQLGDHCVASTSVDNVAPVPVCQRIETDRGIFYIASVDGISMAISPSAQNIFIQALVQITNHSNKAVDFDPLVSTIEIYKDRSEFMSQTSEHRTSAAISGEKAEAKYVASLNSAYAEPPPTSVASPGIQTTSRTTTSVDAKRSDMSTTRPDGTIGTKAETLIVNAPGSQGPARPSTPSTPTNTRRMASSATLLIFDQALRNQTIASERKAGGYMFFEPVRGKSNYKVFRVKVGDITFIFPEETIPVQKK